MSIMDILMLPVKAWYSIWTLPDDYYQGQEYDLISTICYFAFKVIWILVSILIAWLIICPIFGF